MCEKKMLRKFVLFFVIYCTQYSMVYNMQTNELNNGTSFTTAFKRKSRANLVSFEPVGEHIELGLDFLLPFLRVPFVRKVDSYGNEPALINVNTAALISTGILAASSALISYIFKRYVVFGRAEFSEKRRGLENDLEHELSSVLNNLKLVYKNSSGVRVDTTLAGLFATIDDTFQKNDIDLSSCIKKSICNSFQLSANRVNEGNSTGVDKIINGLMAIKWLRKFLRHTSLKDVIDSTDSLLFIKNQYKSKQNVYCNIKYPQCKWSKPEDNLIDIIRTYLIFQ